MAVDLFIAGCQVSRCGQGHRVRLQGEQKELGEAGLTPTSGSVAQAGQQKYHSPLDAMMVRGWEGM